jgi:mono/diheme cytochrome c family protein
MRHVLSSACLTVVVGTGLAGCDYNKPEDYEPRKGYETFLQQQKEQAEAQKQSPNTQNSGADSLLAKGEKAYQTYCVSCHGAEGKANTPTARSLQPAPRTFVDAKWQESVTDEHIATVIRDGGAAVGLSPSMAPWGGALNDEQIQGLVEVVRNFKP